MKLYMTCALVMLFAVSTLAQSPRVGRGDKLFIDSESQFGVALAAAIVKKKVPVVVTTKKEDANFVVTENSEAKQEGTGERITKVIMLGVFAGSGRSFEASIQVTDAAEGTLAFAYNVKKGNFQSAAEAFAKHLNNHIKGK